MIDNRLNTQQRLLSNSDSLQVTVSVYPRDELMLMLMMRGPFSSYKYLCVCACVRAECGQRLRHLLSDQAFSSVGESRWPFSRPSLAPLACAVTQLPRKQNLRTCLPNTSSWDSAASEVLQGSGDESVLLLILSGGPGTRREAGVGGFEGTLALLTTNPPAAPKRQFSGVSTRPWLPGGG